ncbi:MICAL-like protein 2 isoform X1 [Zootoca vivipara]|uniref:MICAL-like protein 2 isoform X1 n=1 Tax=Zootoca vivipara TaxID=8524 RepID=UPI00293B97A3|nr:MICAL-like protein 2 isoform X1 [Zootoca vivipara]
MAAIQALQQWCKQQCQGYRDVSITNMTTSFRDGLAFCAILHRHRPDLINFNALSKENIYENNQLAFKVAEMELGIPALLDAEDMVALKVPDRLSILTYVSQYYNYFHGRSPIGGMSGIKRPSSAPSEEPMGKKVVSEPVAPAPSKPPRVLPPSEPKTVPASRNLAKENSPVAARRILAETSNTRSSNCAICGNHVHLVQRLLVEGKLYHRNCFRCKECSSTLQSGNYKAGRHAGTFVCNRHEQPTPLWDSLSSGTRDVPTEDKPPAPASSAQNYLKGLESKTPAQESVKMSGAMKSAASEPLNPGNHKGSSASASSSSHWSDVTGNKPDRLAISSTSPSPPRWTPSSAKTQQAREKFFQAGSGSSGLPPSKTEPVKNQGSLLNPPWVSGRASFSGTHTSGSGPDVGEKDRARSVLMQALPGLQSSSNRTSGFSSASPGSTASSTSKPSPATSGTQHLETKSISDWKPSRPVSVPAATGDPRKGPRTLSPGLERSPKDLGGKAGIGVAPQSRLKDQPPSRPAADSGHKLDVKVSKAGATSVTEEKSETPADWRSRLKPVANRVPGHGDPRTAHKPADVHRAAADITLSPVQNDKKPAHSTASLANRETASSADQPPKKTLLVPPVDISSGWRSPKQQWEDIAATKKAEGLSPSRKAVAPVRPSPPRVLQKSLTGRAVSPPKRHPDYIPEEEIQKEVRQIEKDLDKLELKGVDMEKELRNCEGDESEDGLMVEWFKLIHEKQLLLRRESELMHKMNQQKLEEKQWDIEGELRSLMSKSEFSKTPREKAREEELLALYVATVNDRNKIVEDLDEDRLREIEEDEVIAAMIQKLDVPRNTQESEKKKTKFGLFHMLKIKN